MSKKTTVLFVLSLALCAAFFVFVIAWHDKSDNNDSSTASEITSSADSKPFLDSEPPEKCDTEAIINAYLSGRPDSLGELDRKVYDKACEIIDECVSSDMTDYEKELAIHDWLTLNCTYDQKALGIFKSYTEHSDDPYGALINGIAICKGYTYSFQMLMDMLEIPCVTISAENDTGDEHAWNMVCLEDSWYYVDVTWDDPVPDESGRRAIHTFFNVSEEFMKETGHSWDTSELPKTDSIKYTRANQSAVTVSDFEGLKKAFKNCLKTNSAELYVLFDDDSAEKFEEIDSYFMPSDDSVLSVKYLEPLQNAFDEYYFEYQTAQTEKGICLVLEFE